MNTTIPKNVFRKAIRNEMATRIWPRSPVLLVGCPASNRRLADILQWSLETLPSNVSKLLRHHWERPLGPGGPAADLMLAPFWRASPAANRGQDLLLAANQGRILRWHEPTMRGMPREVLRELFLRSLALTWLYLQGMELTLVSLPKASGELIRLVRQQMRTWNAPFGPLAQWRKENNLRLYLRWETSFDGRPSLSRVTYQLRRPGDPDYPDRSYLIEPFQMQR